ECPRGIVFPAGASCVTDPWSSPFCKCPAGQAIINGECAHAKNWTAVGTSVAVYKSANRKVNASDVEAPGCGARRHRTLRPATTTSINVNTRSFSCLVATLPHGTDLCALAACPPNSTCSLTHGFAQCICDPGLVMTKDGSGKCVEPCSIKDCGEGGTCVKLPNYEPYCDCKQGYKLEGASGSCIGLVPDVADVAISVFSEVNFGTTTNPPYVFRLKPFTCVTIPDAVVASAKSAGYLYHAPESHFPCVVVNFYLWPNCDGWPIRREVTSGSAVEDVPV
ncbi:unnamed protein product, partial [Closterium sp. Naga37s-1]